LLFEPVIEEGIPMASARIAGLSIFLVMLAASYTSAHGQNSLSVALPSLPGDETGHKADGSGGGDIYCRPPQPLTDSRLMGPQVCMSVKKWNDLHAQGLDADATGKIKPRQGLDDLKVLGH
jgi:hypothetical protein